MMPQLIGGTRPRGGGTGRGSCSRRWGWRRGWSTSRRSSPAASSSGWRWRARSRTGRSPAGGRAVGEPGPETERAPARPALRGLRGARGGDGAGHPQPALAARADRVLEVQGGTAGGGGPGGCRGPEAGSDRVGGRCECDNCGRERGGDPAHAGGEQRDEGVTSARVRRREGVDVGRQPTRRSPTSWRRSGRDAGRGRWRAGTCPSCGLTLGAAQADGAAGVRACYDTSTSTCGACCALHGGTQHVGKVYLPGRPGRDDRTRGW
jgi:hypothetical protein